jgi:hypothetical protein
MMKYAVLWLIVILNRYFSKLSVSPNTRDPGLGLMLRLEVETKI